MKTKNYAKLKKNILAFWLLSFSCTNLSTGSIGGGDTDSSLPPALVPACTVTPNPANVNQPYLISINGFKADTALRILVVDPNGERTFEGLCSKSGLLDLAVTSSVIGAGSVEVFLKSSPESPAQTKCNFTIQAINSCGDGPCVAPENCANCTQDCGICSPSCGNLVCDDGETCTNCPEDCGACCLEGLCVFPGAQGFGASTPAGRGGTIWRVTNLNDSGPGSLREALAASGPRVVIFEISGTITLEKKITIKYPFLTVAGQTAPSPGITLRSAGGLDLEGDGILAIETNDVLLQHLRVRPGSIGTEFIQNDAISITKTTAYNVFVDHCSLSWAIDEIISTWYQPASITLSNSIISEALNDSLHPEGAHSKGFLVGDGTKRVAILRNLFAHNVDRNPFIKGGVTTVVANNVFYNWGNPHATLLGSSDSTSFGPILTSVVSNVYLSGASTPSSTAALAVHEGAVEGTQLFHSDNVSGSTTMFKNWADFDPLVDVTPIWVEPLTVLPAAQVTDDVLARVGARPRDRDTVDLRIINEVRTNGGRVIDNQSEVGDWPILASVSRPLELPANPNADDDSDGYTNLEEWLHKFAAALE